MIYNIAYRRDVMTIIVYKPPVHATAYIPIAQVNAELLSRCSLAWLTTIDVIYNSLIHCGATPISADIAAHCRKTTAVLMTRVSLWLGLWENHEFTIAVITVIFAVYRDLWSLPWFHITAVNIDVLYAISVFERSLLSKCCSTFPCRSCTG